MGLVAGSTALDRWVEAHHTRQIGSVVKSAFNSAAPRHLELELSRSEFCIAILLISSV